MSDVPPLEPLSYCGRNCKVNKVLRDVPHVKRDVDDMLITRRPYAEIIEFVKKHGFEGISDYNLSRHAKDHLTEERRPKPGEHTVKSDPGQTKVTSPEYVQVTLTVPRYQLQHARELDPRQDIKERITHLKALIDEVEKLHPNVSSRNDAFYRRITYLSGELRLWEDRAIAIREASKGLEQLSYKDYYAELAKRRQSLSRPEDKGSGGDGNIN